MKDLDKLKAEQQKTQRRVERDTKRLRELRQQVWLLEKREQLLQLVGVPGAVTVGYSDRPHLRGKPATIQKVNRLRALVDVGGESWTMPFDLLKVEAVTAEIEIEFNQMIETANAKT